jgi:Fusaric acid resistance protein-like
MLSTTAMKKRLDYARFTHLAGMFMIAMLIYLFTTIPHKFWILLTVLVVSAGIEPGLIARRAIHRIGGTFLGLVILIPLLYLMQLNYRFVALVFIIAFIGFGVSIINRRRYDISSFFITIMIFLLLAQTTDFNSTEGPFDMVLNRAICTLIGIAIVFGGDYFLFHGYQYSHKLYLFHQRMVYNFFGDTLKKIIATKPEKINTFLLLEKLRGEVNENCRPIAISSENLLLEKQLTPQAKQRLEKFQDSFWEIRRLIFALCASKFILQEPATTEKFLQQYREMMQKARANFIRA